MPGINIKGKLENGNYTNRDMTPSHHVEFPRKIKSTNSIIPFGKYRGKTFNKYYKIEPEYFEKIIFNSQLVEISSEIKKQLRASINAKPKITPREISSEKVFKLIALLREKGAPSKKQFKAYLVAKGLQGKRINTLWFLFRE